MVDASLAMAGGSVGTHGDARENRGHRRSPSHTYSSEAVGELLQGPAFATSSPLLASDISAAGDGTLSTPMGPNVLRPPAPLGSAGRWGFGPGDGVLRQTALSGMTGRLPPSKAPRFPSLQMPSPSPINAPATSVSQLPRSIVGRRPLLEANLTTGAYSFWYGFLL